MTTHKVYVVTDLGPGDGGKGGVVHKLSTMLRPHTIIKVGGAQGSHGVRNSKGESFAFSQWGCGTLEGVRTHISSRLVVSPVGLVNEAKALRYMCGIHDAFSLLTVDEEALCATPYHGMASRLKELARGEAPRGTIGTGVGEAYRDLTRVPELALRVRDLRRPDLKDRLAAIREQIRQDLAPLREHNFLRFDRVAAEVEFENLDDDSFLDYVLETFQTVSLFTNAVGPDYLGQRILSQPGVAVVESSHGILTDRVYGLHPHTSALRTLPSFTEAMLRGAGYQEQIVNLGVCRAYQIRHGAGPMPTADPDMAEHLLPGSHKDDNRYQGKVRVGPLDLVLLRYALAASGGPRTFDGLAITWFDQIHVNGEWRLCRRYATGTDNPTLFSPEGDIKVDHTLEDEERLAHQTQLTEQLKNCLPEIDVMPVNPESSRDQLYELCAQTLQAELSVPVRMVSLGPSETDKLCK